MAFDVTALTAWVKQEPNKFYTGAVLGAKTASLIRDKGILMTGVKNAETINILETDATFQADGCSWNSSGTTTLTQRTVTVGKVKIQEAICVKTLDSYFTNQALALGSKYGSDSDLYAAIADTYFQKKLDLTASQIETAIWRGDTGGSGNLQYWDGFIKILKATNTPVIVNTRIGTGTVSASSSTTVTGTGTAFLSQVAVNDKIYSGTTLVGTVSAIASDTSLTLAASGTISGAFRIFKSSQVATTDMNSGNPVQSITASNVSNILYAVYNLIPAKLIDKEDLRIFVGMDVFRKYQQYLVGQNYYHYKPDGTPVTSCLLHGTNVMIEATQGLNDTNEIFAMRLSNMAMGVDMIDDSDEFDFVYSEAGREHRYSAAFKVGVNVAFPDEVTRFQLLA